MAPAIPLVAAVAGYATTAAIGTGLLASLGGFVVSTAVNQLGSRLFAKKPKTSAFGSDASGRIMQVRSSVESHKIIYGQARVSGPLVFVATTNDGPSRASSAKVNKMLHLVIPLAGHEVEEIGAVYFNDQVVALDETGFVTSAPYFTTGAYAIVKKHLGTEGQGADALMLAGNIPGWTANHRLRSIAYLYIRLEYSQDTFPLGIPNISAVVKGKKVYDPHTTLTAWSDNAALCIRDYLASDYGFGCAADEINDTYFIAAANSCDEDVTLSTGGTQDRYTCNGVVDTAIGPLENLNQLVSSLAGAITYVQGQFRTHPGIYDTPIDNIPTSMLAGGLKLRVRTPRKELFNAVKGTYVDPNKSWQPTDFSPVTNATYEGQDNDEQTFKDLELPFTTHPEAREANRAGVVESLAPVEPLEVNLAERAALALWRLRRLAWYEAKTVAGAMDEVEVPTLPVPDDPTPPLFPEPASPTREDQLRVLRDDLRAARRDRAEVTPARDFFGAEPAADAVAESVLAAARGPKSRTTRRRSSRRRFCASSASRTRGRVCHQKSNAQRVPNPWTWPRAGVSPRCVQS